MYFGSLEGERDIFGIIKEFVMCLNVFCNFMTCCDMTKHDIAMTSYDMQVIGQKSHFFHLRCPKTPFQTGENTGGYINITCDIILHNITCHDMS